MRRDASGRRGPRLALALTCALHETLHAGTWMRATAVASAAGTMALAVPFVATFDGGGRAFKNRRAPTNLEIPPHHFASDSRVLIGTDLA